MHKNLLLFPTFLDIDKSAYINYNIIRDKVQMYQNQKGDTPCT